MIGYWIKTVISYVWLMVMGSEAWELELLKKQARGIKYITSGAGSVICLPQPFKAFKGHIATSWTNVYDMFEQDVTADILRFASQKKHFHYTAITPTEMLYYETELRFRDEVGEEEWIVPASVPVLEVLRLSQPERESFF